MSIYYSDYLQLNRILESQTTESSKHGIHAEDEMLFIIIHQTYELWFKQLIYEVSLVKGLFAQEKINDVEGDVAKALHKLNRCKEILEVLIKQIDVMETMTPLDFLDFRDLLRPASGFQSIQFKILEAELGLPFSQRYGQEYYISQLRPEDVIKVKASEQATSLKVYIDRWLVRMPYLSSKYWNPDSSQFWNEYMTMYAKGLVPGEENNLDYFKKYVFESDVEGRSFSPEAMQNALFIMVYRDYPMLQQPWRLLDSLMDIDELLATWRYRHFAMVKRIIGHRVGTGGSTGANYLKAAADTHYIYKDISSLTSFLIPRHQLPTLPPKLVEDLGDFWN